MNAKLLLAAFYAEQPLAEAERRLDAVATDPKSLAARANVAEIILKEGIMQEPRRCSVRRRKILPTTRRECEFLPTTTSDPGRWTRPRRNSQAGRKVSQEYLSCGRDISGSSSGQGLRDRANVITGLMKRTPRIRKSRH